MKSRSPVAIAGSNRSALTTAAQYMEQKRLRNKSCYPKCSSMMLQGRAVTEISLSFSFVQLIGSASNKSLEQLGETKFSFVTLFLAWK